VFAVLTGPVGIAIAIIAALIAIGVLLYKNWDTIKAKASEIWQGVVDTFEDMKNNISTAIETLQQTLANVWNKIRTTAATAWNLIKMKALLVWGGIKKAITDPIAKARDKIQEIFEKIKSFFPINVGNILSGIKLPHFSISGELDLKKGKVPHLAVDWYAKGGIFDSPSIIGVGEAGPEAVVPLDRLWSYLDTIAANGGGGTVINVYGSDNMSVNDLAAAVESRIIAMQKRRALAWQ
jgi:phage-related protein